VPGRVCAGIGSARSDGRGPRGRVSGIGKRRRSAARCARVRRRELWGSVVRIVRDRSGAACATRSAVDGYAASAGAVRDRRGRAGVGRSRNDFDAGLELIVRWASFRGVAEPRDILFDHAEEFGVHAGTRRGAKREGELVRGAGRDGAVDGGWAIRRDPIRGRESARAIARHARREAGPFVPGFRPDVLELDERRHGFAHGHRHAGARERK